MSIHLLAPEHTQKLDTRLDQDYFDRVYKREQERGRSKNTELINQDLTRTQKAIIILGCSYADGQGSIPQDMQDFFKPVYREVGNHWDYSQGDIPPEVCAELALEFDLPLSYIRETKTIILPTKNTELDNSWGSQIGQMFDNEYTIINCADRGFGNNSSIQKLLLYPIDWSLVSEVIVLWSVCDYGRYSILQSDDLNLNYLSNDSKTFWPCPIEQTEPEIHREIEWYWQRDLAHHPRFYIERYIENCQQLKFFCDSFHTSKLIKIPAFSDLPEQTPEWYDYLNHVTMLHGKSFKKLITDRVKYGETWNVCEKTMLTNLLYHHETSEHLKEHWLDYWNSIRGTGSQGGMFTPCTHPSIQGQTLIAERLHNYMVTEVL